MMIPYKHTKSNLFQKSLGWVHFDLCFLIWKQEYWNVGNRLSSSKALNCALSNTWFKQSKALELLLHEYLYQEIYTVLCSWKK